MGSVLVARSRRRSLVPILVVLVAGCNGVMTEPDTVGTPSPTAEQTSVDENASVAWVTLTAQEQVTVELVIFVGDGEEGQAMTFYRLVRLDTGETHSVRIPAIPDADETTRDQDSLVVGSTGGSSAETEIASCQTYSFAVTNDSTTHTGTSVATPSADSSSVETVTEGLGTEPPTGQCS